MSRAGPPEGPLPCTAESLTLSSTHGQPWSAWHNILQCRPREEEEEEEEEVGV